MRTRDGGLEGNGEASKGSEANLRGRKCEQPLGRGLAEDEDGTKVAEPALRRTKIEYTYRRALEENADASKSRDAALTRSQMRAKVPTGLSGERTRQSICGHTFPVAKTFAVDSTLRIAGRFLGWE
jgi:hypothetical protein